MKSALPSVVRDLQSRRGRERRGRTLVEGVRLVDDVRAAGITLHGALVSPMLEGTPRGRALKHDLLAAGVPLVSQSDDELGELAETEQPQGIIAVTDPPVARRDDLRPTRTRPLLVLDAVQDPGNVGTMLRTALALGAAGVVLLDGSVELGNPKVLRASMGAAFRLPAVSMPADEFLAWAAASGLELWAADLQGAPLHETPRGTAPVALVMGNEGAGLRPTVAAAACQLVRIPIDPGAESLNVGVAAAILLYELRRGC